jgi:Helix-turn-helix domain
MGIRKRRSDRCGRAPLRFPGRPPVSGRRERHLFRMLIANEMSSEVAAIAAGVSQPLGPRWFREAGGTLPAMFRPTRSHCPGGICLWRNARRSLLRVQGLSLQEIGRRHGRSGSTISREVRRNAATRSGVLEYRATTAQWHAERSARRPKATKLARNAALRCYVEERLTGVVSTTFGGPVPGPTGGMGGGRIKLAKRALHRRTWKRQKRGK